MVVWGPAGLHRARQVLLPAPAPAALPVVALLVSLIVLGGAAHARRAAETVKGLGDLREQGDMAQSDSILALYDVKSGRPVRVSSGNVPLVELTAAERATRTLRSCPSGGR